MNEDNVITAEMLAAGVEALDAEKRAHPERRVMMIYVNMERARREWAGTAQDRQNRFGRKVS